MTDPVKAGLIGTGKTYATVTYGCQMNVNDTEVISGLLETLGYCVAEDPAGADLVLINTCAVRKKPEQKVAALLGKLALQKEKKSNLFIAVGGCMPQQEEVAAYIERRFPFVDLIFGTHALPRLPELLVQAHRKRKGPLVDIGPNTAEREGLPVRRAGRFQAWVPVSYGCNNFCSYCIVPYVRGRECSRDPEAVLQEVKNLARNGYREVTLLGQNVNSYGKDLVGRCDFATLLGSLDRVEKIERIRFMTSHPKDLSPDLIAAVRDGRTTCEHFHLPVQAGSNRILKLMNRHYTRECYLELLHAIRDAIPGVALTTDIIIGFPGEGETDFQETYYLLEEARFDNAYIFIYSPRRGTAAATLCDRTTRAAKKGRLQKLMELQREISAQINNALVGTITEVLVEGTSKNNPDQLTGRTRTNKLVHFPGAATLAGTVVKLRITAAHPWSLMGERP